jgi:hypothetical protein
MIKLSLFLIYQFSSLNKRRILLALSCRSFTAFSAVHKWCPTRSCSWIVLSPQERSTGPGVWSLWFVNCKGKSYRSIISSGLKTDAGLRELYHCVYNFTPSHVVSPSHYIVIRVTRFWFLVRGAPNFLEMHCSSRMHRFEESSQEYVNDISKRVSNGTAHCRILETRESDVAVQM